MKQLSKRVKRLWQRVKYIANITPTLERVTNIFDYYHIIHDRRDVDVDIKLTNGLYGFSYILKRYSGFDGTINASIEHAPGLEMTNLYELQENELPFYLVCSEQRAQFLNGMITRPIIPIGPSICYANAIYPEFDIKVIKKNLGKTLCVYPVHNIEDTNYLDDAQALIKYVKEVKEAYGYETVLVSMYFVDIERGRHLLYEREGWITVSAGRRMNYDFNDCMRTIIEISDYAIFQSYTSAVGYCIYLGTPVTIFHQDKLCEYRDTGVEIDPTLSQEIMDLFDAVFGDYDENISDEKYEFCRYWYGYDVTWSPDEMRCLLEFMSDIDGSLVREQLLAKAQEKHYELIRERLLAVLN